MQLEILVMTRSETSPLCIRALQSIKIPDHLKSKISCRSVVSDHGVFRELALKNSSAEFVFFMDEDCYWPGDNFVYQILSVIKERPDLNYCGGLYLSEPDSSYVVRGYNQLCNNWVFGSLNRQKNVALNLLGGCLLVQRSNIRSRLMTNPIRWGGEDTYFLRSLQTQGLMGSLDERLNIIHAPSTQTLHRFRNRALLHGRHRRQYGLKTSSRSKSGVQHAFRNLKYWPIWAGHFAFLKWAEASGNR